MTKAFSLHVKDNSSFSVKQVEQRVILHYVRLQTNSNKFYIWNSSWELEITLTVSILNTAVWEGPPRKHARSFLTRLEARHEFDKILSSKRNKGMN